MDQQTKKCSSHFKMQYRGSIFWLIFWLIFFFPLAFVLLLTDTAIEIDQTVYDLKYNGSRFWLGFWVLVFFPIAFLLLFLNGLTLTVEKPAQ
jgi:hypothetical protein